METKQTEIKEEEGQINLIVVQTATTINRILSKLRKTKPPDSQKP